MSEKEDPLQGATDRQKFEEAAADQSPGMTREFLGFLSQNKKWWLAPIIVVMLLLGLLVFLGGTGVAPFIYTLF